MYDYGKMLLAGQSTLLEGAWHYLGNHGDSVTDPGVCWKLFTAIYIIWLVFEPIIVYLHLRHKRKLRSSRWNWKKIIWAVVLYATFSGCLLTRYQLAPMNDYFLSWLWLTSVLIIPILIRLEWKCLSLWCRRYIVIASLFAITCEAGIYMEPMTSLIAIVVSLPLFYYFVGHRWIHNNKIKFRNDIYLLIVAGLTFWTAQYGAYEIRALLMALSFGLTGFVSIKLWRQSQKIVAPIIVFLNCSLILPSIALGYNQFSCFGAKRISAYTDYRYSYRGLLMVRSRKYYAIRDRFGYIMPPIYNRIESLGDSSKPYVKVKSDGKWGIYDLERQEYIVEPDSLISNILPHDENVWKLKDKDGNGFGYDLFFVSPDYYYRYHKKGTITECPFENKLAEYCL